MQKQQAVEYAKLHQPVLYIGHRRCTKALCALKLISLPFLSQLILSLNFTSAFLTSKVVFIAECS